VDIVRDYEPPSLTRGTRATADPKRRLEG